MEAQPRRRLLPLLLVSSWPFFLLCEGGSTLPPLLRHRRRADEAYDELHPVVLLPGYTCSQIDAKLSEEYYETAAPASCVARKVKGKESWFRLWENSTALRDPQEAPCYADQLRLVYDGDRGDYRNVAGVRTRVASFGTTRCFGTHAEKDGCMAKVVKALEGIGYKESENLFGAPYDFRYAPAPPGKDAMVFSFFVADLRWLVEHASSKNCGKPVILVTHSFGGSMAVEFLMSRATPWRRTFVKHLVMISTGGGGIVAPLRTLAASAYAPPASLARTARSYGTVFSPLPSPKVFGDAPLVVTRCRNYSAHDIPEFLAALGFSDEETSLYRTRALPVTLGFRAPRVPMTAINGVGVPTPQQLVYWDCDYSKDPEVVNGDGDGVVNLASVLALDKVVEEDPEQAFFKSVKIVNATHGGIITEEFALKRVISEILEANRATYTK